MGEVIVIKGGTVIDGTGAPRRTADVLIADGKIARVGVIDASDIPAKARVLDAGGHVVAPGFIDIHTHYDAQVFWDPALTPSCFHGVTTVVAGNCGFSIAPTRPADRVLIANTLEKVEDMDPAALNAGIPWDFETFPEYLASVERRGTVLNFAAYIGHTPLRMYVMGRDASARAATVDEVAQMAGLVREAIDAGAAGFATSFAVTHLGADGRPIPSRWAERDEIEALCGAVADAGRGVVGINGGENLGFRDTYELQLRIGAPVTYTALLTLANGAHLKAVEIHKQGRARGADVWPQVSCRPLSFSMTMVEPFTLNTSPVFAELMAGSLEARRDAYRDPAWRQRVRDGWAAGKGIPPRWDTYEVMESEAHNDLVGERLLNLAGEADPFDVLLDLAIGEPDLRRLRVKATLANDDAAGVADLLRQDGCTLGLSDAGAHVGQLCDAPLATDLLGTWVRERGVLTLENAINKLTKVQADLYGFAGRGAIREGAWADVVVFDPDTVAPGPLRRLHDFPAGVERLTADQPTGMRHLLVNGTVVQDDGTFVELNGTRPGVVVRPSPRS
jgi:N-acyl-D-amino-acid deacylase